MQPQNLTIAIISFHIFFILCEWSKEAFMYKNIRYYKIFFFCHHNTIRWTVIKASVHYILLLNILLAAQSFHMHNAAHAQCIPHPLFPDYIHRYLTIIKFSNFLIYNTQHQMKMPTKYFIMWECAVFIWGFIV